MYLANVLMLVGFACLTCSGWFLASAVIQFVLLNSLVIPDEEATLQRAFPEASASWFSRTRRWL
jgi:protein-S-isoprenylcysteine O-methyltransferase Ste14